MRRQGLSILLGISILVGCGGGGASSGGSDVSAASASSAGNVVTLSVGPGPAAANGGTFNIPYASVTLCQPGTATCSTINNVLVDTGSTGLRIFASALAAANLSLPPTTDPLDASNTIGECIPFIDGYTWGPLALAKLEIGGETAGSLSINIIDDNGSYTPSVPTACTSLTSSNSLNSVAQFHANGVLGVGLRAQDCGASCADCAMLGGGCTSHNDVYYSCNSISNTCISTSVPLTAQVVNPVGAFPTDNNGVILQLPSLPVSGATGAQGTLTFGIGTQSNNGLENAEVLTTDDFGFFTTTFNGQVLSNSFIDSGSNAFFFDDNSLRACSSGGDASRFYCPTSTQSLSATNEAHDANGNPMGGGSTVSFQIANLDAIANRQYAIGDVGGAAASSAGTDMLNNDFDFGLAFFYGRRVFTAIEGTVVGSATGPFYAY
jgi:Protein of unknown function (DUF3443)